MTNKISTILFVSVILIIISFPVYFLFDRVRMISEASEEMSQILKLKGTDAFDEEQKNDPWGVPYITNINYSNEKVMINYIVLSAGPDRVYGTSDDIIKNDNDLNWTSAGNSLGKRAGRTARGFIKGLLNSGDSK